MPIDLTLEQLAALEQINFDDYDAAQTCRRWIPQLVAMARKALKLEKLTAIDAEKRIAELMADNDWLRRQWKKEESACDAADLLIDGLRTRLADYLSQLSGGITVNKKRDTGGLLFLDAPTVVELRRLLFEIAVIRDRRELFAGSGMPAPYANALRDMRRLANQAREIVDPEFKREVEWNRAQERGVELIKAAQLAPLGPLDNQASYWRSLWRKIKSA